MRICKSLLVILIAASLLGACSPPATPDAASTQVAQATEPRTAPTEPATQGIPTEAPTIGAATETATAIPTEQPTAKPQPTPVSVQVHERIQYGASGNQVLDVYQPQVEGERPPTLLLVHGRGSSKDLLGYFANYFARRGYAVVAFNKGLGQYPSRERDSFCALAWIHSSADTYGFDPERVVLVGFSLGGAQAAFLGTVDDTAKFMEGCPHSLPREHYLRGVVAVAGYFDYTALIGRGGDYIPTYFGPPEENMEELIEASPVTWVDGTEPPFLLVHGENDHVVDPVLSVEFAARLSEAGVDVELVLLPNLAHEMIEKSPEVLSEVIDFLDRLFSK